MFNQFISIRYGPVTFFFQNMHALFFYKNRAYGLHSQRIFSMWHKLKRPVNEGSFAHTVKKGTAASAARLNPVTLAGV